MKKRFFIAIKKYLIIFAVLFAYLIWIFVTDIKFPCLFHQLTGFQCSGCGMTRMCLSLLKLDFKSAFYYNPYIFVTSPIILACFLIPEINYIRKGKYTISKFMCAVIIAELVGFVVFGILRNVV